jgi:hypothetical protein
MMRDLEVISTSQIEDRVSWSLEPSRVFSTRSVYLRLLQGAAVSHFEEVWRTRVPHRVRIFLGSLFEGGYPAMSR